MGKLASFIARDIASPAVKMGNRSLFPGRVSEANQGRGQPRRGYHRPKPATHSGAGRKSRRAACFLWYFLSRRKKVRSPVGAAAPSSAPQSARQAPSAKVVRLRAHQRAFRSPFGNLRAPKAGEIFPIGLQAPLPAPTAARQAPSAKAVRLRARQRAFLGANNRRGSHCRALRLLFA